MILSEYIPITCLFYFLKTGFILGRPISPFSLFLFLFLFITFFFVFISSLIHFGRRKQLQPPPQLQIVFMVWAQFEPINGHKTFESEKAQEET